MMLRRTFAKGSCERLSFHQRPVYPLLASARTIDSRASKITYPPIEKCNFWSEFRRKLPIGKDLGLTGELRNCRKAAVWPKGHSAAVQG